MTARKSNDDARAAAGMDMLLRYGDPPKGFAARVPWQLRFYLDQFVARSKIRRLEGDALVRNCAALAREIESSRGGTQHAKQFRDLAELIERHGDEVVAYATELEAEVKRRFGGL